MVLIQKKEQFRQFFIFQFTFIFALSQFCTVKKLNSNSERLYIKSILVYRKVSRVSKL